VEEKEKLACQQERVVSMRLEQKEDFAEKEEAHVKI